MRRYPYTPPAIRKALSVAGFLSLAARLLGGETEAGVEVAVAAPVKPGSLERGDEGEGMSLLSLHALEAEAGTAAPERGLSLDRPDLRRLEPPPRLDGDPGDESPWIQALALDRPDSYTGESPEPSPFEFSPWYLFYLKFDKWQSLSNRPNYSFDVPLFHLPPPRETEISRKVKKVVMSKIYRELRSKVRSEWKSQFRDHPSISYAQYERRLIEINNIGKDPSDVDQFNVEYTLNEVKQDFFRQEYADGESDIPLVTWGPFTVTDRGSMRFDLGTATHAEPADVAIDLGNERRKPLIGTDDYRIDTSFILNVNPFRAYTEGDALYMIRRYGVNVEVGMLSDVLKREMVAAEFEFEADLQGEFAVFANFVIKSR
jgi:hypothetical protein